MASYQPEVYFGQDWHGSGNRFATRQEAESFVANLAETWNPKGFIRDTRVVWVEEPANAVLDPETRQAHRIVVLEELEPTSEQVAVFVEEERRKSQEKIAALRERVWQCERRVKEESGIWDRTNLEHGQARQLVPLNTAEKLLEVARKELKRTEERFAIGERAARGAALLVRPPPPDLRALVLEYGCHDRITGEAWKKFDRDMELWKSRMRAGETEDEAERSVRLKKKG